jgi:hypothetical protein
MRLLWGKLLTCRNKINFIDWALWSGRTVLIFKLFWSTFCLSGITSLVSCNWNLMVIYRRSLNTNSFAFKEQQISFRNSFNGIAYKRWLFLAGTIWICQGTLTNGLGSIKSRVNFLILSWTILICWYDILNSS